MLHSWSRAAPALQSVHASCGLTLQDTCTRLKSCYNTPATAEVCRRYGLCHKLCPLCPTHDGHYNVILCAVHVLLACLRCCCQSRGLMSQQVSQQGKWTITIAPCPTSCRVGCSGLKRFAPLERSYVLLFAANACADQGGAARPGRARRGAARAVARGALHPGRPLTRGLPSPPGCQCAVTPRRSLLVRSLGTEYCALVDSALLIGRQSCAAVHYLLYRVLLDTCLGSTATCSITTPIKNCCARWCSVRGWSDRGQPAEPRVRWRGQRDPVPHLPDSHGGPCLGTAPCIPVCKSSCYGVQMSWTS